jgi:hypothetical protein
MLLIYHIRYFYKFDMLFWGILVDYRIERFYLLRKAILGLRFGPYNMNYYPVPVLFAIVLFHICTMHSSAVNGRTCYRPRHKTH